MYTLDTNMQLRGTAMHLLGVNKVQTSFEMVLPE